MESGPRAFTPDNTLLLSAARDRTLRVQHLLTARLVDVYRFDHTVRPGHPKEV